MSVRRGFPRAILAVAAVATMSLVALSGVASAASPIDGVWSFNGGAVALQQQPNGSFQGTVVQQITFAHCPHPVGEAMWTNIHAVADGSYDGDHQWFYVNCTPDPTLGLTAWRVLTTASGARFLRVCLSSPGQSATQPTIAADGSSTGATFGCYDSALIEPLPIVAPPTSTTSPTGSTGTTGTTSPTGPTGATGTTMAHLIRFAAIAKLPSTFRCVRRGTLKVALANPPYDPLAEVVVLVNGKQIETIRGPAKLSHGFTLRKLPHGHYTVTIDVTTVLSQHLSGSRHYRSCAKH